MNILLTNTGASNFNEVLERAKVIIMGESHLQETDRANIAAVVNRIGDAQLFIEGCSPDMPLTVFPEIKNRNLIAEAKNWDTGSGKEKINRLIIDEIYPHLKKGRDLLSRYAKSGKSEDLKQLSREWLECYENTILRKRKQLVDETFAERNLNIVDVAKIEGVRLARKAIIIGGRKHISPTASHEAAVKQLWDSLMDSGIPFAILDQKEQIVEQDLLTLFQERKGKENNGRVITKLELDTHVKNLEEQYQNNKPFRSAQIEYDILTIAVQLIGLDSNTPIT